MMYNLYSTKLFYFCSLEKNNDNRDFKNIIFFVNQNKNFIFWISNYNIFSSEQNNFFYFVFYWLYLEIYLPQSFIKL